MRGRGLCGGMRKFDGSGRGVGKITIRKKRTRKKPRG